MSRSATCSRGGTARRAGPVLGLAAALAVLAAEGEAQVLITQEEALRLAFPEPAEIDRRTVFLDEREIEEVRRLADPAEVPDRAVITYYVGQTDSLPIGAAYFDAHRVRTLQEVLMVVVNRDGLVSRIEVLGFAEPPEYMAPEGWLALFRGRGIDRSTSTRGDIPVVTGATLTSHSVSAAVRRSLALHGVIRPFGAPAVGRGTAAEASR